MQIHAPSSTYRGNLATCLVCSQSKPLDAFPLSTTQSALARCNACLALANRTRLTACHVACVTCDVWQCCGRTTPSSIASRATPCAATLPPLPIRPSLPGSM